MPSTSSFVQRLNSREYKGRFVFDLIAFLAFYDDVTHPWNNHINSNCYVILFFILPNVSKTIFWIPSLFVIEESNRRSVSVDGYKYEVFKNGYASRTNMYTFCMRHSVHSLRYDLQ